MKTTDRYIAPNVWVSAQIYFGSKRRIGSSLTKAEYRARLLANAKLMSIALQEFRKYLDFSKDTDIRLTSLKKWSVRGTFNGETNIASIRYRTGFKSMLETLAHELVHGEQFHQGKLKYVWDEKNWAAMWKGKKHKIAMMSNIPAYMELPWEKEAFQHQEALAAMVYVDILKRIGELTDTEREVLQ